MSHLFPTYTKKKIQLAQGKGATLYSKDGKSYLDFMAGIAVTNLGHAHPAVVQALHKQADLLWHASNLFYYDIQEEAAKLLANTSVCDYVFFCNSGTEANEAAIKLARKATEKTHIVTMKQSFHGRTLGSMAATGQADVHSGFGPMLESFSYANFNDVVSLEEAITPNTAAIMIEVVQGEGGVHVMSEAFASALTKVCTQQNILLIIDEIQTGMGRTGKMFAYEHLGLNPDIITVAKGLGNGFPVGAMLAKAPLQEFFQPGSHGSTFGGNPLASAVVIAVLNELTVPGFLDEVDKKAAVWIDSLIKQLQSNTIVREVRNQGFLIGIEMEIPAVDIINACEEQGLLLLPAGKNVVRFLPPLTVTEEEWEQAKVIFSDVVNEFERMKLESSI
ncbi:acetylornithine transaminase [Shouchella patagoniensis]|uniref:acetylornithine transaminase n=1 Tax=Shouchella patagoniensis TaxID=228576 RepID=UPI0009951A61|nr:acetylornithine transaminase [Shouchella patagoniensis]